MRAGVIGIDLGAKGGDEDAKGRALFAVGGWRRGRGAREGLGELGSELGDVLVFGFEEGVEVSDACLELGFESGEFSVVAGEGVDECLEFHYFLNVDGEIWSGGEGLRGSEGLGRRTASKEDGFAREERPRTGGARGLRGVRHWK